MEQVLIKITDKNLYQEGGKRWLKILNDVANKV